MTKPRISRLTLQLDKMALRSNTFVGIEVEPPTTERDNGNSKMAQITNLDLIEVSSFNNRV